MKLLIIIGIFLASYVLYSSMKKAGKPTHPLSSLVSLISNSSEKVSTDINLYLNSPESFLKKYELELRERDIESVDEMSDSVVVVEILLKNKFLIYVDGAHEPNDALLQLNILSKEKLQTADSYNEIMDSYRSSKYGIATFLQDGEWPSLFKCANEAGFKLLAIDEDSDSLPLILVPLEKSQEILKAFREARLKTYFSSK
ncbi:hypothetical protein ACCI51_13155 [Microbulbifer echini]|uniref:DUF6630 domain-containing protein n=1 Tax=Microbulbifer echini TaxID=1529067 RepID=A0ABV4NPN9_9GAMM